MSQMIRVGKRASDKVVCWRVEAKELTPNTEIVIEDPGITLVVKVNGERRIQMRDKSTVFGLFNAGKDKKFFGGNKPYKEFDIYAIDQSSGFDAGWAFGINDPLAGFDHDLKVNCDVLARGSYKYKINNFVSFVSNVPMTDGEVTADDVANLMRTDALGIIRPYLTSELKNNDINQCQANYGKYSQELLIKINNLVESKGMQVTSVNIETVEYSPTHMLQRLEYEQAVVDNAVGAVKADTVRTIIETRGQEVSKVDVPLINAQANLERNKNTGRSEQAFMFCPSCGTRNDLSNTSCKKCGMSFKK